SLISRVRRTRLITLSGGAVVDEGAEGLAFLVQEAGADLGGVGFVVDAHDENVATLPEHQRGRADEVLAERLRGLDVRHILAVEVPPRSLVRPDGEND